MSDRILKCVCVFVDVSVTGVVTLLLRLLHLFFIATKYVNLNRKTKFHYSLHNIYINVYTYKYNYIHIQIH